VLVLINVIICNKLHKLEIVGAIIAVIGCVVLMFDPFSAMADNTIVHYSIDLIDFASSVAGALYFLLNANLVSKLPVCLVIFIQNIHNFVIMVMFCKLVEDD
jgi:hypothetical protein